MLLITADLHLTDRPADEYRWRIFPWIRKWVPKKKITGVIIAGDLTDQTDRHSSVLVNRVLAELKAIQALGCSVHVLMGNHDYIDVNVPFFDWLNAAGIPFVRKPFFGKIGGWECALLPHAYNPAQEWGDIPQVNKAKLVVLHQPLLGARMAQGKCEKGLDPAFFKRLPGQVVAGDIHVPQHLGKVVYCGSPHPVNFGDVHDPRVLLFNGKDLLSLPNLESPRKAQLHGGSVEEVAEMGAHLSEGDMVQMEVVLGREELAEWPDVRRACQELMKKNKWVNHGVTMRVRAQKKKLVEDTTTRKLATPEDIIKAYCKQQKIEPALLEAAQSIIGERNK